MKTQMKFELKPYNLNVTDKEMIDDLIKVASELKKEYISVLEYSSCGIARFHGNTISRRFNGWNNALENAGLKVKVRQNLSDQEILDDLKRVASLIEPDKITIKKYEELGKFSSGPLLKRLGWNNALTQIGLEVSNQINISKIELFNNLEEVWIKLGHQPGKREMIKPISLYSETPYRSIFGTWRKALEAFVEYIDSDIQETQKLENENNTPKIGQDIEQDCKHKTKREPNNKLKLKVMWKDGNICKLCGVKLSVWEEGHFDHITPWSKGGETTLENLQILCVKCNLLKGNYDGV